MDDDGISVRRRSRSRCKVIVGRRPHDDRPQRRQPASPGLLQLRRDGGPFGRASRVQVRDDADALSDQRRRVPTADDRAAAGPRGQRDQTGRDALVDDDPDDGRRHDLQRARTGDARTRRRRPSRRPLHRASMYGINPRTGRFFVGSTDLPGGGWGAKHDARRHERGRLHQRRRHAQRRDRSARRQRTRS